MKKIEEFKIPKALPKELARCADLLYHARNKRLEVQRRVDAIAELETKLKDKIIAELPMSKASGVAGCVARVQIEPASVPQVEDWPTFYAYIKKRGAFELLQRRLNDKAITELWEAKKKVPGVTSFGYKKVSCTKLGGKK